MDPVKISVYSDIKDTAGSEIELVDFLNKIKEGYWQDLVLPIRAEKDKKKRNKIKENLPNVCVSGVFSERLDAAIKRHSGYIAIDIDGLGETLETVRGVLSADPHVFALFTSVSGLGICMIVPIDGSRHRDAFAGMEKYMHEQYQIIIDKSGKNESRARYASFDPDLHVNTKAIKFKKYLPKQKPKKYAKYVYVQSDFDEIINALADKNVCELYEDWISIGYALASHLNEGGRQYFHALSASASSYDYVNCDKVYKKILETLSPNKDKLSSIGSIYHLAKINGIPTYSEQTKRVLSSTTTLKKSGLDEAGVISNLEKFEDIKPEESRDIVKQAFAQDISYEEDTSIITLVENWLKYNHELKRNAITRRIENHGIPYRETDVNTIFLSCKKIYEDLTFDLFIKILFSNSISEYHPLRDFFDKYKERTPRGVIDDFWTCFFTGDGVSLNHFGTKWLISIISAVYGGHSPLMLVFTGGQNTGKTEAFRRLLPKELQQYYAESKLENGKDDDILMTQKLIIMDDEMGGKNKQESKRLKEMLSKQVFSLRVPYGKGNEDLERLAVLCGTSNDTSILNDPTGNRRIIPVEIISIDQQRYNRIDKIDLMIEAYHLFKSGFEWQLSKDDIIMLNSKTERFMDYTIEYEHIQRYLILPKQDEACLQWSCTEIKNYLERQTLQKLSLKKLGMELKTVGFKSEIKKVNGKASQVYYVQQNTPISVATAVKDLPFGN